MSRYFIDKFISGAQVGADIAALRAVARRGYPTGGTMPKGFRTKDGPRPDWAEEFGLAESHSPNYPPRTWANVRDSDMTIRIAVDYNSPGERLTATACRSTKRRMVDIPLYRHDADRLYVALEGHIGAAVFDIVRYRHLLKRPLVINIAGNARIDIEPAVEAVMSSLLDSLQALQ